ncbi:MAG: polysaccharide deacetylase family protein [Candidatus Omnitrophota bacterium]
MLLFAKGNKEDKTIYLTFDDGPNPYVTLELLKLLDNFQIKAAFFLVGKNIKSFPNIVKEIYKRGHIIGNHSFSHSLFFSFLAQDRQRRDLEKTEGLLKDLGIPTPKYLRPPNAIWNKKSAQHFNDYTVVGVNHYILDNLIFSPAFLAQRLLISVRNRGGGILVLHDGVHPLIEPTRKVLVKALETFISKALSENYKFSNLDALTMSNVLIEKRSQQ